MELRYFEGKASIKIDFDSRTEYYIRAIIEELQRENLHKDDLETIYKVIEAFIGRDIAQEELRGCV